MLNHRRGHHLRVYRAAAIINVETIRAYRQRDHLGAKLVKRIRRGAVGRPIRTIDNDLQTIQTHPAGQGRFGKFDITANRIQHAPGAAKLVWLGQGD